MNIQIADFQDYITYLKATNRKAYAKERAIATQKWVREKGEKEMQKRIYNIMNRKSVGNGTDTFNSERDSHNSCEGRKAFGI